MKVSVSLANDEKKARGNGCGFLYMTGDRRRVTDATTPTTDSTPMLRAMSPSHATMATSERPVVFYHLCAITTALIWSFSYIHIIWLDQYVTPLQMVLVRHYFYAPALILLWVWRKPQLKQISSKQWLLISAIAIASGIGYHFPLAWGAEKGANASLIGLIIATIPVHVGWLAWIILKEKLTVQRIVGLSFGLAGVTVVLVGRLLISDNAAPVADIAATHIVATCAIIIAAMVGGLNNVMTRRAKDFIHPIDLVCISGTIGVTICFLLTPFASVGDLAAMPALGWWAAFYLGVPAIAVAYMCWFTALSGSLPAVSVAMYLFIPCVLSATWAWLWQNNQIGLPFFIGAALVLGGLLAGLPRHERRQATS